MKCIVLANVLFRCSMCPNKLNFNKIYTCFKSLKLNCICVCCMYQMMPESICFAMFLPVALEILCSSVAFPTCSFIKYYCR